jgi:hypothetical protein
VPLAPTRAGAKAWVGFRRQYIAQRFGALHSAKAATEDDDAFGAHPWRGKQLTSTGKLVTTDKLPVRCVLRWILCIFNRLWSNAETGTGEAEGAGRPDTIKTSMLMKTVAALAIAAASRPLCGSMKQD